MDNEIPTYLEEVEFQRRVAQRVGEHLSRRDGTPSDILAKLLNVSRGVAYKRLHSKAFFTARELAILQDEFDILISAKTQLTEPLLTFRAPFGERPGHFDQNAYLDLLEQAQQHLQAVEASGQAAQISTATSDMPIFYFFSRPALAALKLFCFALEGSERATNPISLDRYMADNTAVLQRTSSYARTYLNIAAVEIWSRTPLDNFLRQVLQLVELGLLQDERDVDRVFDEILLLLTDLHASIERGSRENGQPFSLMCNEIHYTNSLILQEHPVQSVLYVTFDNPHYLVSLQTQAIAYFGRHFNYLKTMSDPISRLGQFSAFRFLQLQTGRVDKARQKARLIIKNRLLDLD